MVKESIGWGGLTGITGALLAREGFTGVTPILLEPPYRDSLADLGHRFRVLDTYLKLYACCRWAHPAIEGVREILRDHDIRPEAITEVHVETFGKALSLNNPAPESSEAAQYSLPFAVAAFLLDGEVGPQQVVRGVSRPDILALARRIVITMDDDLEQPFPRECLARVTITTKDGRLFRSGTMACRGDPERPLSEEEIHMLFCQLVQPFVVKEGTTRIREAVETLEKMPLRRFIGIVSSCLAHV
jgi:2-methylcitrate dehydratase PrpD